MAQQQHQMEKYWKALGDHGTLEQYTQIAIYKDDDKDCANAGHYHSKIGIQNRLNPSYTTYRCRDWCGQEGTLANG